MKQAIITASLITLLNSVSMPAQSSNLDKLNHNLQKCYEATEKGLHGSVMSCNEVITSNIVSRENKAIAYHNRAVIYFNKGDKKLALKNIERALVLRPTLLEKYKSDIPLSELKLALAMAKD